LNCKDSFGSVTHKILELNLRKLGVHGNMVDLIIDSYGDVSVRIWNSGIASNFILILKGIKQGCSLKAILSNICINLIFAFVRR
jgi:hypothetical protein